MLVFPCSNPSLIALCWWSCPQKPASIRNTEPRGLILHGQSYQSSPCPQVTPGCCFTSPEGCKGGMVGRDPRSMGAPLAPCRCITSLWCPCCSARSHNDGSAQGRRAGEAKPGAPQAFLSIPVCKKHAESNRWEKEVGEKRGL